MQLMNNEFNAFKVNDLPHVQMLKAQKMKKKITNMLKYKCEALSYITISVICKI